MRYNERIIFVKTSSHYDANLGKKVEDIPVTSINVPCNVNSLGIKATIEIFGKSVKNALVARLQYPYIGEYDYVLLRDKKYKVSLSRRNKDFYLEEV